MGAVEAATNSHAYHGSGEQTEAVHIMVTATMKAIRHLSELRSMEAATNFETACSGLAPQATVRLAATWQPHPP